LFGTVLTSVNNVRDATQPEVGGLQDACLLVWILYQLTPDRQHPAFRG